MKLNNITQNIKNQNIPTAKHFNIRQSDRHIKSEISINKHQRKDGCKLEFQTHETMKLFRGTKKIINETMKLFRSTKKMTDKMKNGENVFKRFK